MAVTAASGLEALDILDHRHVDAALCDVMMPGMDGAETLREIRQRMLALPVIMMSAMMTATSGSTSVTSAHRPIWPSRWIGRSLRGPSPPGVS